MSTSTAPEPRPLRADAERNRQRLVASARELFATRGLEVTLDDVAHHAGVGVGTAYRRFANRAELVEAVLAGAVDRVADVAERALTSDDPWGAFEQFFLEATTDFAENRGLRQILLEGGRGTGAGFDAARDRLAPAVEALITRAQESGHLRTDIAPTDFPLIQLMLGAVTERSRDVAPDLWRRYVTLLLDGLRTHRDSPTPLGTPALSSDDLDRSTA
ncbi:TetR family transcriptional regulator [Isoptericola jiangsuensis]|uniref:TetR family transcriptional regulator n=1 Tax=Isoptericola jiangsuensis TaxID=548579 RepID=A0A2A9ETC4_9MICO|nr:TetR/AcrR family transcriptional regulator [Isoptericola jiangsuensis]PFG41485.1 TetR family transcriptional regulator [Isoptericola jiangsuensis]